MDKSRRLEPIVDIAKMKEEDAAKVLSKYRQRLDDNLEKLGELKKYHDEYTQRFQQASHDGIEISKINEYRHFMVRLNDAIRHQMQIVESSRNDLNEKNKLWFSNRARHQALDKVVDRYRDEERRQRDRGEQLESDERSQRIGNGHSDITGD